MTGSTPDDRVVLDPSPADRLPADLLPLIDHVTPNASEAGQLTGVTVRSVDDAAAAACAVGGYGSQESYPTRAALAAMAVRVRRASTRERQRAR